jgi:inhibitor of KinA
MWTNDPPCRIGPISETAVSIDFGGKIGPETQQNVLAAAAFLEHHPFPGLLAVVPAYTSVTVFFDLFLWKKHGPPTAQPLHGSSPIPLTAARLLCVFLEKKLRDVPPRAPAEMPLVDLPVRYGGEHGPDLSAVAERLQLTENEVVELHAAAEYTVQMVGFLPGFPYIGPLPEALRLPRRDTPRLRVPPGSVAIAGAQTGIYPQASPGGWHLIGRTDFQLFDPAASPPARLQAGWQVRFVPA